MTYLDCITFAQHHMGSIEIETSFLHTQEVVYNLMLMTWIKWGAKWLSLSVIPMYAFGAFIRKGRETVDCCANLLWETWIVFTTDWDVRKKVHMKVLKTNLDGLLLFLSDTKLMDLPTPHRILSDIHLAMPSAKMCAVCKQWCYSFLFSSIIIMSQHIKALVLRVLTETHCIHSLCKEMCRIGNASRWSFQWAWSDLRTTSQTTCI